MGEFVYTKVSGKLKDLLTKIREIGIPSKANNPWLNTIGYKSTNDRSLINVLKYIKFISEDGTPTEYWQQYRGKDYKIILAKAIIEGYSELYSIYPKAHECNPTELDHFFSSKTSSGKQVIQAMVNTFQALTEQADFNGQSNDSDEILPNQNADNSSREVKINSDPLPVESPNNFQPKVHIDLQIHIASDASADQIDKIFESMAKHIFNK